MEPHSPIQDDGHLTDEPTPPARRRLSMEEDLFYQQIVTAPPRRPSLPPPYKASRSPSSTHATTSESLGEGSRARKGKKGRRNTAGESPETTMKAITDFVGPDAQGKGKSPIYEMDPSDTDSSRSCAIMDDEPEPLPNYSNSIALEGIFVMKHEIEETTKRAEDRRWHTVFVSLNGTALSIYSVKKDWGWGRTREGPTVCPDNPPWIRKAKLEKTYSLLHADAGIAADYKKRRYVIRIRAETDQFLLCCIELSTFVKWLECLFAAIDVAAPIDDRDFPRDMSIPRVQRIRWYRTHSGLAFPSTQPITEGASEVSPAEPDSTSSPQPLPEPTPAPPRSRPAEQTEGEDTDPAPAAVAAATTTATVTGPTPHPRVVDPFSRMSTSSYPNPAIDPHSGKWLPDHQWSTAHDLLYAKLCYNNLLFRSPRKSNYIINKGKQWFVDWGTGKMVRVLPPAYGEVDYFGPWQVVHTENRRI